MVSVCPTNIIFFHISSFIYYESLKYYRALQLSTWGKVLTYFFPDLVFFTWQLHSTLLILFRNFIPTPIISSSNDGSMDSSQTRASGSDYSPPSSSQMMPMQPNHTSYVTNQGIIDFEQENVGIKNNIKFEDAYTSFELNSFSTIVMERLSEVSRDEVSWIKNITSILKYWLI